MSDPRIGHMETNKHKNNWCNFFSFRSDLCLWKHGFTPQDGWTFIRNIKKAVHCQNAGKLRHFTWQKQKKKQKQHFLSFLFLLLFLFRTAPALHDQLVGVGSHMWLHYSVKKVQHISSIPSHLPCPALIAEELYGSSLWSILDRKRSQHFYLSSLMY